MNNKRLCLSLLLILVRGETISSAFSRPDVVVDPPPPTTSRRDVLWKIPVGVIGTYGYGRLLHNAFSVNGIKYPEGHERRVESTLLQTVVASVQQTDDQSTTRKTHRILEVGMGTDCRSPRRGIYSKAFDALAHTGVVDLVELTGVDLQLPSDKTIRSARQLLQQDAPLPVHFQAIRGSITERLKFSDGYFDSIICCLVLCIVSDQVAALAEIKRLLRPDGGCLGYIEHVAVDDEEPYRLLALQQQLLDPLQQRLADNCHLHRHTETAISDEFGLSSGRQASLLQHERFLVDAMWPVTCQSCGVVQRRI